VRVAQCLLDAGVPLEWIHSFHAEAPGVIIHKERPPPGSVPVGLSLPPVSFHHVDADTVHSIERMHSARVLVAGVPSEADFSAHAFQPLSATHPATRVQLQLHYGFEVHLHPPGSSSDTIAGGVAAGGHRFGSSAFMGRMGHGGDGHGHGGGIGGAEHGDEEVLSTAIQPGKFLGAFTAARAVAPEGGERESTAAPATYTHTFSGGECRSGSSLRGGLAARVHTHCGACTGAPWSAVASPSGLVVCNFSYAHCAVDVHVALAHCPVPVPLYRVGLDVGTEAGHADVLVDGVATPRWDGRCAMRAQGNECVTVRRAASGNLTLYLRVLHGNALVQLRALSASRRGLDVGIATPDERALMLSGATESGSVEPPATRLTVVHACEEGAAGAFDVHATVIVHEHAPATIGWRWSCDHAGRAAEDNAAPQQQL
jgi:hypothetical protein